MKGAERKLSCSEVEAADSDQVSPGGGTKVGTKKKSVICEHCSNFCFVFFFQAAQSTEAG